MRKAKAMTAGAIALTLVLGGGGLLANQYVNAATASGGVEQSAQAESGTAMKDHGGRRGGFGHGFAQIQEQLLTYLGLEEAALRTKLETMTLAEVAAEQGKTRAELKEKLTQWLEAAAAAKEDDAAANADEQSGTGKQLTKPDAATMAEKLLDSKGFGFGKHGGRGFGGNLDAVATALGLTADGLKTELAAGKTITAIAAEKGVDVQKVIDVLVSDRKTKLAEELAAGTITQEQYDTRLAEAVERATQHVNGELPLRGEGGRGGGFGFGRSLDAVAEALGLTAEELKAELDAGKTIAAVAAEKNVAVQTLIDMQVNDRKTKLAEQLAAGTITQEQYDTRLAEAVEHATQHVNGELPPRGMGGMGGHGGKGPRGERPDGAAAGDNSSAGASA